MSYSDVNPQEGNYQQQCAGLAPSRDRAHGPGARLALVSPECERGSSLSELAGCAPEPGIPALLCKGMRAALLPGSSSRTACLSPLEFPREPCRGRGAAVSIHCSLSVLLPRAELPVSVALFLMRASRRFPPLSPLCCSGEIQPLRHSLPLLSGLRSPLSQRRALSVCSSRGACEALSGPGAAGAL